LGGDRLRIEDKHGVVLGTLHCKNQEIIGKPCLPISKIKPRLNKTQKVPNKICNKSTL
jgi:hypothetical protein